MTSAFRLIAKVLSGRVPPRALLFSLLNKLHHWAGTGNRRYELERLYAESPDPWNYEASAGEHRKYERVLACVLARRKAAGSALDIGCSVGVFSGMLAQHFGEVTAVDFSREALGTAARRNAANTNMRFVRSDLRSLDLGHRYNVIICAEMLNYLSKSDVDAVCTRLGQHLAADGVIVVVVGAPSGEPPSPEYGAYMLFDGWVEALAARFTQLFAETVQDPHRPYVMAVFAHRG